MKINKSKDQHVLLETIPAGDVGRCEGTLYMVCTPTPMQKGNQVRVVNLETGDIILIFSETKVFHEANATLQINN